MLRDLLALFGLAVLIGVVVLLFTFTIQYILNFIDDLKSKYRIKHRFDKPPLAECYCIDCSYFDGRNGRCDYGIYVHDSAFCWRAEPRKRKIKE